MRQSGVAQLRSMGGGHEAVRRWPAQEYGVGAMRQSGGGPAQEYGVGAMRQSGVAQLRSMGWGP